MKNIKTPPQMRGGRGIVSISSALTTMDNFRLFVENQETKFLKNTFNNFRDYYAKAIAQYNINNYAYIKGMNDWNNKNIDNNLEQIGKDGIMNYIYGDKYSFLPSFNINFK